MLIDPKSPTPIYTQIVRQMCDAIDAGVYRPGESLPSLRALAVEIRVNPNTVQRAYEELERDGIIEPRRGVGVFVVDRQRLSARNQVERKLATTLRSEVTSALKSGLSPSRVRELFESALGSGVRSARRQ